MFLFIPCLLQSSGWFVNIVRSFIYDLPYLLFPIIVKGGLDIWLMNKTDKYDNIEPTWIARCKYCSLLESSNMKGKKKPSKWVTAIAVIVSVLAIYLAFDIGRGTYYNNLGTAYMAEGEYDQAISCFAKALKARRKSPEAYCNRGTAYSEKGEHDKAIPDLNKAIELNPEFAECVRFYSGAM